MSVHFSNMSDRDINFRYSDTMVLFNNRLFFIRKIQDRRVFGYFVSTKEEYTFLFEYLDSGPPKLGYVNIDSPYPSRILRRPSRFYKQGICSSNLRVEQYVLTDNRLVQTSFNENSGHLTLALENTIGNIYPTFNNAIKNIKDTKYQAFSRYFCVVTDKAKDIYLLWRNNKVGEVRDSEPELYNEYSYLNESLRSAL